MPRQIDRTKGLLSVLNESTDTLTTKLTNWLEEINIKHELTEQQRHMVFMAEVAQDKAKLLARWQRTIKATKEAMEQLNITQEELDFYAVIDPDFDPASFHTSTNSADAPPVNTPPVNTQPADNQSTDPNQTGS